MRQHLESNGCGLPQTLAELNARIKTSKGSKKQMWRDIASKLSDHFGQVFDPDRVCRKWRTLVDAYKKVKDNSNSAGRGTMRFKFFSEMEALLGGHHDVDFPIVGTSEGIDIRRPDELSADGRQQPTPSQTSPSSQCSTGSTQRQRLRTQANSLVELLHESEATSQRRHEELSSQMRASQVSF